MVVVKSGHTIHEDEPLVVAKTLVRFGYRIRFVAKVQKEQHKLAQTSQIPQQLQSSIPSSSSSSSPTSPLASNSTRMSATTASNSTRMMPS